MLKAIFMVGAGSFCGGTARFLVTRVMGSSAAVFPLGTLLVNVLGCFLVGIIYGLFERGAMGGENLKLFLTVGFCGGFTTFSTFIHENYLLFTDRNFFHFVLYATISFGLGLILAHLGHCLVKMF